MALEIQLQKKLHSSSGEFFLQATFAVQNGERIAIIGPSGSGKTTLLRMLAGLLAPDAGYIYFKDQIWFHSDKKINLLPQKRPLGLMFQEYALFPNMTVQKNLEYALQKGQSKSIVEELIRMVELGELVNRYPNTLSGGQQQRVAVARAVVNSPKLILADEPTGNLDSSNGNEVMELLTNLNEQGTTIIMVTHSEHDARYSHRIIRMLDGQTVTENILV